MAKKDEVKINKVKESEKKIEKKKLEKPEKKTVKPETKPKKTPLAKAGKRSKKAIAKIKEKEIKQQRKTLAPPEQSKKKVITVKNLLKAHSKSYRQALKEIDRQKYYDLSEAIGMIKKLSNVKFDASLEIHINLGINPKQADQNIRGSVIMPEGIGKKVKVAVLANEKLTKDLKAAGADICDEGDLLTAISKAKLDFDVLVSTPEQMVKLGRYAKVLGPKGLMPSPKSGTVTVDPVKIVKEIKSGRIEFRNDSYGILHLLIGKKSFKASDLLANARALLKAVSQARPSTIKTTYIKSIYLSSTMSPSVKVDVANALKF
ncbi:MAG: 50S ribosomal protein L1 [bacterium]|nr:50S ribosomal protein L1 [bacterium]